MSLIEAILLVKTLPCLAVGFWQSADDIRKNWGMDKTWQPSADDTARTKLYVQWKKAVTRTFDWVEHE